MTDEDRWKESASHLFIADGDVYTPDRAEHLRMLMRLVPATADETFWVADLSYGAGSLSEALLQAFPRCQVLALDVSPAMLEEARKRLDRFTGRIHFEQFDLFARDWLERLPANLRCVASSPAIHHLDGPQKQQHFRDVHARLAPGGVLLILDLVEPRSARARAAFGAAWDDVVREQSERLTRSLDAYHRFQDGWNHYVTPDYSFDKPAPLFDQLEWLRAAGFTDVDCFWLRAGQAL